MIKQVPNVLSWSRIVFAAMLPPLYLLGGWCSLAAFALFLLAALTDYFDGKIARVYNVSNAFGKFLDPVADKVLVIVTLLTLVAEPEPVAARWLLALLAGLVILREVAQSALRDWMAQAGRSAEVEVSFLSKSKTALQLTALSVLLGVNALAWLLEAFEFSGGPLLGFLSWTGVVLLAGAALAGLVSLGQFLRIAFAAGKE